MPDINPADYQPGTLIHNHPDSKYHAAPGLSSSAIKCFVNRSPRHYQYFYLEKLGEKRETEAMLLGTLVHCLVLEPDTFEQRYERAIQADDYDNLLKTVPELRNYCLKHGLANVGLKQELVQRIMEHKPDAPVWEVMQQRQRQSKRKIVSAELWDKARWMRDSVYSNATAASLLCDGHPEVSVWGSYRRELVKCRCDWLRDDGACLDLKTCKDASPDRFGKDIATLGYGLQEVHYVNTLNTSGRRCDLFAFIAVESEPPYLTQAYTLDDTSRQLCRDRYDRALDDLAEYRRLNQWPGYGSDDEVLELSLPFWHRKQLEAAA